MRSIGVLAGISSLATALASRSALLNNRIFGADNIERHIGRQKRPHYVARGQSIAAGNRHGGPHLNARECARRVRQMDNARG